MLLKEAPDTNDVDIEDLKQQIGNLNGLLSLHNPIVIEQAQTIENL